MQKTTVYLPDELKTALSQTAHRRRISEAELIRESIAAAVQPSRPRPRGALFTSGEPLAERVDDLLAGFGHR